MNLRQSIVIKGSAEKIWPFLIEPEKIIKWCSPISTIRRTSKQSGGLQTTFYFEEKAVGRTMKLHFIITEWVLNKSVAFKMVSGNLVKSYSQRYTIEPVPEGSRLTCFEEVTLPFGFLGKCAGMLRAFVSNRLLDHMLKNLKYAVEI